MVKHLPKKTKESTILWISGAFVFRFGSLFMISFLVDVWQVQAIGAIYLMFIAGNHLFKTYVKRIQMKKQKKKKQRKTRELLVDCI